MKPKKLIYAVVDLAFESDWTQYFRQIPKQEISAYMVSLKPKLHNVLVRLNRRILTIHLELLI